MNTALYLNAQFELNELIAFEASKEAIQKSKCFILMLNKNRDDNSIQYIQIDIKVHRQKIIIFFDTFLVN